MAIDITPYIIVGISCFIVGLMFAISMMCILKQSSDADKQTTNNEKKNSNERQIPNEYKIN